MKKVLALTLSAVLAMGAATTAMAYTINPNPVGLEMQPDSNEEWTWQYSSEDKLSWGTEYEFELNYAGGDITVITDADGDIVGAFDENGDNKTDVMENFAAADKGTKWNAALLGNDPTDLYDLVDASKASLKVTATDGKEYVDTLKIVEDVDVLILQLTTTDSLSTKDGELSFKITLADRGSNSKFSDVVTTVRKVKIGDKVAEAINLGDTMTIKEDGTVIDTDDMEATEDFEFIWGDNEIARFIVDIDDNDGKKNLSYTTAPVDALIEANPTANMDFFTLKAAPSFNKIGEMTIYADGDVFKYLYEIDENGQIKEVNATYDEDEEGFVFTTRKLTSYVVSDIELVGAAIDEEVPGESDTTEVPGESDTTTDDGRENPATGANDMVNVAAAMAVVSLAAAGAVAFKKSSK